MLDSPPTADSNSAGRAGEAIPEKATTSHFSSTPRLLCVRDSEPSWVHLTQSIHAAGLAPPRCVWVSTCRDAISRLREEPFDCILINIPATGSFVRDDSGPFGLIRALRTGGCEDPVVIVGRLFADAEWMAACEADCDVFVSARGWESPVLGAVVKRAIVRGERMRESSRLNAAHHRRLLRERDESEQLLAHQRQLIAELEALPDPLREDQRRPPVAVADPASKTPGAKPGDEPVHDFAERYSGLLRSYVLMGSGSLASEIAEMADCFVAACLPPPEALQLHLMCVERLVKGLGNRSARHVIARADLLAIELMTHLAHRSQRAAALGTAISQSNAPHSLRNVSGAAGIDLTRNDEG
jgi:hypothetical protein